MANPALQGLMQAPSPGSATPDTNPTPGASSAIAQIMKSPAGQQQPGQPPKLSHAQTTAVLFHLQSVGKQLQRLATNPGLGKENIRPAIFDATADMLGQGLFTLPQLMNEIKSLPTDPPGQKKWVMQHLQNIPLAMHQVLDDHRQTAPPGSGNFGQEAQTFAPGGEAAPAHSELMSQVAQAYKGGG